MSHIHTHTASGANGAHREGVTGVRTRARSTECEKGRGRGHIRGALSPPRSTHPNERSARGCPLAPRLWKAAKGVGAASPSFFVSSLSPH